jgi:hypothetical protein
MPRRNRLSLSETSPGIAQCFSHERSLQPGLVGAGLLFRSRVSLDAEILIPRHRLTVTSSDGRCRRAWLLQCHGSPDLCWAAAFGAKFRQGVDDREARYRHPLASGRFQVVLALQIPEQLRPVARHPGQGILARLTSRRIARISTSRLRGRRHRIAGAHAELRSALAAAPTTVAAWPPRSRPPEPQAP